jgi:hypothetical protein
LEEIFETGSQLDKNRGKFDPAANALQERKYIKGQKV